MRMLNTFLSLLLLATANPVAEVSPAPQTLDGPLSSRDAHLVKRCQDDCYGYSTRWDYWWYGVGSVVQCGDGQKCSVAKGESTTLTWTTTVGLSIGFPAAKGVSSGFAAGYSFAESNTASLLYTLNWHGPAARRLWVKQWYAVTDVTCRRCTEFCCPDGCWPRYAEPKPVRFWVPCTDGSCSEFMIDDPGAAATTGTTAGRTPDLMLLPSNEVEARRGGCLIWRVRQRTGWLQQWTL
ncbi:hypothetical protein NLG97_g9461 [Lecanicillium saksenae]|uniref:Uncharacterized protein n=1 Tax=Lecanicillium saksenae TaxID=468837 RepID=A0ACC1QG67_9HYPO|nr:hypothetical protein NLG97_g9461 [Lecanicillium saksenae]